MQTKRQHSLVCNTLQVFVTKAECEVIQTMIKFSIEELDLQLGQIDADGGLLSISCSLGTEAFEDTENAINHCTNSIAETNTKDELFDDILDEFEFELNPEIHHKWDNENSPFKV